MRRMLQRGRGVFRRVRDLFPLTVLGIVLGGASGWALFHWGLGRIDLLLLVVGIVGMALVVLCVLLVSVTALVLWLKLRRRRTDEPIELECGFAGRTGFSVGSPWFVPFVRVGWTWKDPEAHVRQRRRGLQLHEEVTPTRRALHDAIVRRMEVSDSFGLTRVTFDVREERKVRFHPSSGALREMQVVRSMSAGEDIAHPDGPPEGERADMRQYSAGDPIKYVLWKVFARTREVVVRTPERAIGPVHQTVAYLVTGRDDEPAAGAARVAVDTGALGGDWILGADGCDEPVFSKRQALELLARSSRTEPEDGGAGLAAFLRDSTPGGPGRALVFVPARPGPWIERVLAAVRQLDKGGRGVEFVVCTDGVERPSERSLLKRVAWRRSRESFEPTKGVGPASAEDVASVCRALGAARARVLIVDRVAGRVYTESHLPTSRQAA